MHRAGCQVLLLLLLDVDSVLLLLLDVDSVLLVLLLDVDSVLLLLVDVDNVLLLLLDDDNVLLSLIFDMIIVIIIVDHPDYIFSCNCQLIEEPPKPSMINIILIIGFVKDALKEIFDKYLISMSHILSYL